MKQKKEVKHPCPDDYNHPDLVDPPKLRKGQKCRLCKKEIKKGSFCYNGFWWHEKCKEKDTAKRIKKYLK